MVGLQVVNEAGFALAKGGILCYIEIPISQGDSYVLTEKLAGRITVAARAAASGSAAARVPRLASRDAPLPRARDRSKSSAAAGQGSERVERAQ